VKRLHLLTLAAAAVGLAFSGCGEAPDLMGPSSSDGPSLAAGATGLETITFESLPAGTILSSVYTDAGSGPILINGNNPFMGGNSALVFDSANPTGGDFDLGTPNQACGGPGDGTEVGPGTPYENCAPLGKILVVASNRIDNDGDGLVDDPDDFDQTAYPGVWIEVNYMNIQPVTLQSITVVDIDGNGPNPRVEIFDTNLQLVSTVVIPNDMPNNGVAVVDLGGVSNVRRMRVYLNGSGGIDNIVLGEPAPEPGELGDTVFCDINGDGIQDPGEWGLEGVVVHLTCTLPDGTVLTDSQLTDADGHYLFTNVPAGECYVTVDVSTAPAGCDELGTCPTDMTFDLGPGESFLDADFCFRPPMEPISCCESGGKPKTLTMVYTGQDCSATFHSQDPGKVYCEGDPAYAPMVHIIATEKPFDFGKIFFEGDVPLSGSFVIAAANAGIDELKSNTTVHVYDLSGNLLQYVKFHTSCSQPLFTGDQFGSLLLLDCGDGSVPGGDSCCESGSKPVTLTMTYTGEDCSASLHDQDPGKVVCEGDPAFTPMVHVVVTEKPFDLHKIFFEGDVALDESFTLDARNAGERELKSNTTIHVYDLAGNLLQYVKFHTSCSQPLRVGDQFGSMLLVECGDGSSGGPTSDGCDAGKPQVLEMRYTGEDCTATHHSQDPSKVTCSGDPGYAPLVHIKATDKSNPNDNKAKIWFEGDVALGETFAMDSLNGGENHFKADTFVHITAPGGGVLQTVRFHTSCSQPLNVGDQFGSLLLEVFTPEP